MTLFQIISVALVLSLPPGQVCDVLLTVTYVMVVFSIVVQGLTIGPLLKYYLGNGRHAAQAG